MRLDPDLTARVLAACGAPAKPKGGRAAKRRRVEAEWQRTVTGYAKLRDWLVYHTFDSRRSAAGFPDLAMVRRGRFLLAELKSETGRVSLAQLEWANALAVAGVEYHLWRPCHWPEVQAALR